MRGGTVMASTHVNFRIKKEEKELIDLINSQSNLSDFMRDLLKKEANQKDIEKENDDLKKELEQIKLKLDTLQQSMNMINMIITSNAFQVQPIQPVMNYQPTTAPNTQSEPKEPDVLTKKIDQEDMDDSAFDFDMPE